MKTTPECIKFISTHPWLKKQFLKLSEKDVLIIADFLDVLSLNKEEASIMLNRLFLDNSKKPKKWLIITELISCCISFRFK